MDLFNRQKIKTLEAQVRREKAAYDTMYDTHINLVEECIKQDEHITAFLQSVFKGKYIEYSIPQPDSSLDFGRGKVDDVKLAAGVVTFDITNRKGVGDTFHCLTEQLSSIKFITKSKL